MANIEKKPKESLFFKATKRILLATLSAAKNKGGLELFKTKLLLNLEANKKMKPHEKDELRNIIQQFGVPAAVTEN